MIIYSEILSLHYPTAQWSMLGNDYESLVWLENTNKPTKEELDALWDNTQETQAKKECKEQAMSKLTATDWTQVADCPLLNKSEFTAYRAAVRELAINPVANPVFPELPTEQW